VDKWQKKLGEEVLMWRLLRVSCGAFLDLFFLGDTLLEDSFKGGHHFFLWASRPKTYTIRPKIQGLKSYFT